MKKILALFLAALPLVGSADLRFDSAGWTETQALTRANTNPNSDTTPAASGMSLAGVHGYRVMVSATSGQTLSGTGTLHCWYYSPTLGRWVANSVLDISVSVSGSRDQVSTDYYTAASYGRVLYAADSITVSGGSTVVVSIEAQRTL